METEEGETKQNTPNITITPPSDTVSPEASGNPSSQSVVTVCNDPPVRKRKNSHSEPKIFLCKDCNKSFTQQAHLNIHQRKHTGERPYVCGFSGCSKSFTQLGNLKTHERKHTGERPFKCKDCGKSFSQMGNMKTHEQLHRGIRPYPCNINGCDKSFTQLGNLKSHQAKVHSQNPPNQDSNNQVILDTKVLDPIPESSLPIRKRKLQKVDLSEPKKRILTEPNKNDAVIDKQKGTETDVNSTSTGVNTDLNAVTKLNENHLYSIIEVTTDQSETVFNGNFDDVSANDHTDASMEEKLLLGMKAVLDRQENVDRKGVLSRQEFVDRLS